MLPRVIQFWDGNRYDVALLVKTGRKFVHIIPMDAGGGLRVVQRPADDDVNFTYLDYEGERLEQALIRYASVAKRVGATAEARRYIETALDEVIKARRRT